MKIEKYFIHTPLRTGTLMCKHTRTKINTFQSEIRNNFIWLLISTTHIYFSNFMDSFF